LQFASSTGFEELFYTKDIPPKDNLKNKERLNRILKKSLLKDLNVVAGVLLVQWS
jgi:hypothetical protein